MAHPKRYMIIPHDKLPEDVRKKIEDIRMMRSIRRMTGAAAVTGAGGIVVAPRAAGSLALLMAAGTFATGAAEKAVVRETRGLGELLRRYPWHYESALAEGFTHAHVSGKGNIVLTREPRHKGREMIPKALKPATWRWRMKVPI